MYNISSGFDGIAEQSDFFVGNDLKKRGKKVLAKSSLRLIKLGNRIFKRPYVVKERIMLQ